jgi:hypothetical protein
MNETVIDRLMDMARAQGATYPTFAVSSDEDVIVVDTDSGRTWMVELKEF